MSKSFQPCGVVQSSRSSARYDIVTFRGRRGTLCGLCGVETRFSWQARGIMRLRGVAEVTFRGRRSTLRVLHARTRKVSWQAQAIVRLRAVVELHVNVAVTLWGWRVNGRCLEGLESRNCLAGRQGCRLFEDVTRNFWRKSRTKRLFCRLQV